MGAKRGAGVSYVIPPTVTTDSYTSPNPATFDFNNTPYSWGYLNVSDNPIYVSLLVGSGQGQASGWSADYPVHGSFVPVSSGSGRRTNDVIMGVKARSLTAGQAATISGAFYQPGEVGIVPGVTGTGAGLSPSSTEPTSTPINLFTSGTHTIVAGVPGARLSMLYTSLMAAGNVQVKFQSDGGPTDLSGQYTLVAATGFVMAPTSSLWVRTLEGEGLAINLSANIQIGGILVTQAVPV